MVNSIQSSNINPVQILNAVNAFKNTEQINNNESNIIEPSNGVETKDNSLMESQDVDEIKLFAKIAGEDNLSNEDIKYGVTYGRSVIADYVI